MNARTCVLLWMAITTTIAVFVVVHWGNHDAACPPGNNGARCRGEAAGNGTLALLTVGGWVIATIGGPIAWGQLRRWRGRHH